MKSLLFISALIGGMATLSDTRAEVIFNNGAPDLVTAFLSDRDTASSNIGDNFSLSSAATVSRVSWSGAYAFANSPGIDAFTIEFYNITAGTPGLAPFASYSITDAHRTSTGNTVAGRFSLFDYYADISALDLTAGDYLISIVNDTATDFNDEWAWATTSGPGLMYNRDAGSLPWNSFLGNVSFQLEGTVVVAVPEPGALALFGAGLAAFGAQLWRRKV